MQSQRPAIPTEISDGTHIPVQENSFPVRHALIIAAGSGARFGKATQLRPKPLLEVAGVPLIVRTIRTAQKAGITQFTVITGYRADDLEDFLQREISDVEIRRIRNDQWQRPNGLSALQAQGRISEPFLLMMSDHLFEADIIRKLQAAPLPPGHCRLAVDYRLSNIPDIEDATKVQVEDGRIIDIGKMLSFYNAVDTGIFLCSQALFDALETAISQGRESLSDGILELARRGQMEAADIGSSFWQDVDNERDLKEGEERLLNSLMSPKDSWLTRKINRRISLSITKRLANTSILPNHITLFNLVLGLIGAAFMLPGTQFGFILGTLFFLLSSILDGCDGEIARLKFLQSRFGAWLDTSTDNVTHIAIFSAMTLGVSRATGSSFYIFLGALLVLGSLSSLILSIVGQQRLNKNLGPIFSGNRLQDFSRTESQKRLAIWLDRFANRDFAYLLVVLALADRMEWFLWAGAAGSLLFAFFLYKALGLKEAVQQG